MPKKSYVIPYTFIRRTRLFGMVEYFNNYYILEIFLFVHWQTQSSSAADEMARFEPLSAVLEIHSKSGSSQGVWQHHQHYSYALHHRHREYTLEAKT